MPKFRDRPWYMLKTVDQSPNYIPLVSEILFKPIYYFSINPFSANAFLRICVLVVFFFLIMDGMCVTFLQYRLNISCLLSEVVCSIRYKKHVL